MQWDAKHQLSRVTVTREQGRFTHTEHWGYDYDPFGRRIAKYRLDPDNEKRNRPWLDDETTHYAWDGNRLLLERQGDKQQLYVYEPNSFVPLALVRSEASNDSDAENPEGLPAEYQTLKELYPQEWEATLAKMPRKLAATIRQLEQPAQPNDSPLEILYYHTDHLGTPRELTDNEGHIVWSATYRAWGNTARIEHPPRLVTSPDGNTLTQHWEAQTDPIEQNLRFQGQYYDQETGLHYNRFRYYDPDCGRFVSQDPIGLLGGVNNYQYAANPVGWVDPLGLCKCPKDRIEGVETPYGVAKQSKSPAAVAARTDVEEGATLYRIGTLGKSQTAEAQFWSLEHPFSPGYASKYGIPAENVANANFMEAAILKPGTSFITRPAPGIGSNIGGGIEVVVPSGGINMKWFTML